VTEYLIDTPQINWGVNTFECLHDGIHNLVQREAVFRSVTLRDSKVFYLHLSLGFGKLLGEKISKSFPFWKIFSQVPSLQVFYFGYCIATAKLTKKMIIRATKTKKISVFTNFNSRKTSLDSQFSVNHNTQTH
jgi:hypothetical protein